MPYSHGDITFKTAGYARSLTFVFFDEYVIGYLVNESTMDSNWHVNLLGIINYSISELLNDYQRESHIIIVRSLWGRKTRC
ncbi:uncharacterized protein LOC112685897 isoform X2 [Sipha flava]|uniref:Uncharacterized protein LOC112685897 isoform X2 n=1 Tax=Sipha flava TaxID=143950 RepID=A0A8B8FSI6_9HEMI|nr:uncharacterized protein LOC112685897 isoform X2 [Sipha flava]